MERVLCIFGTRPEVPKMAPVVEALAARGCEPIVLATRQHGVLLDRQLAEFGIAPRESLPALPPERNLAQLTGALVPGVHAAIERWRPSVVLAQGDTASAFAAGLAAYFAATPFGHVEAGLRTDTLCAPRPEEGLRRLASVVASWHFAPTERARAALLREGHAPSSIHVVGNPVVDSLRRALQRELPWPASVRPLAPGERLAVVTVHRRENRGAPLERILAALRALALRRPEARLVFPVHPDPSCAGPARRALAGLRNVEVIEPVERAEMIALLRASFAVLTDSGGLQEEASYLGRPLLVFREETERREVVEAGGARLVGSDPQRFEREIERLFVDPAAHAAMAQPRSLHGDGRAGERIASILAAALAGPARAGAGSSRAVAAPVPAAAVARWLFSDAVQVRGGEHDGAVAGWLDEEGQPAFLYPEAGGYYLTALAFAARALPALADEASTRARRAARWLRRLARDGAPPTRIHRGAPADFRTEASFAFDLAICWRGAETAASLLDGELAPLRGALLGPLSLHCPQGEVVAARPRPGALLPRRWSTEAGAYQLKVAAALLCGGPAPDALDRSARGLLLRWDGAVGSAGPELHPLLYALEGNLLLGLRGDGARLEAAHQGLRALWRAQRSDGTLPSRLDEPASPARADVLAQALRLGAALAAAGVPLGLDERESLRSLRAALAAQVAEDGAVCFAPLGVRPRHWNVWAAIFAFQALWLHDRVEAGALVERSLLELLA